MRELALMGLCIMGLGTHTASVHWGQSTCTAAASRKKRQPMADEAVSRVDCGLWAQ
jgi:hypothetical protein